MIIKLYFRQYPYLDNESWEDWTKYLIDVPSINKKIESDNPGEAGVITLDSISISLIMEKKIGDITYFRPREIFEGAGQEYDKRNMFRLVTAYPNESEVIRFEGMTDLSTVNFPIYKDSQGELTEIVEFTVLDKIGAMGILNNELMRDKCYIYFDALYRYITLPTYTKDSGVKFFTEDGGNYLVIRKTFRSSSYSGLNTSSTPPSLDTHMLYLISTYKSKIMSTTFKVGDVIKSPLDTGYKKFIGHYEDNEEVSDNASQYYLITEVNENFSEEFYSGLSPEYAIHLDIKLKLNPPMIEVLDTIDSTSWLGTSLEPAQRVQLIKGRIFDATDISIKDSSGGKCITSQCVLNSLMNRDEYWHIDSDLTNFRFKTTTGLSEPAINHFYPKSCYKYFAYSTTGWKTVSHTIPLIFGKKYRVSCLAYLTSSDYIYLKIGTNTTSTGYVSNSGYNFITGELFANGDCILSVCINNQCFELSFIDVYEITNSSNENFVEVTDTNFSNTLGGYSKGFYGRTLNEVISALSGTKLIQTILEKAWVNATLDASGLSNTLFPIPTEYFVDTIFDEPFSKTPADAIKYIVNSMLCYLYIDEQGVFKLKRWQGFVTNSHDIVYEFTNKNFIKGNKKLFWEKISDSFVVNVKSWKNITERSSLLDPDLITGYVSLDGMGTAYNFPNIKPRASKSKDIIIDTEVLSSLSGIVSIDRTKMYYDKTNPADLEAITTEQIQLNLYAEIIAKKYLEFYGKRHLGYTLDILLTKDMWNWSPAKVVKIAEKNYIVISISYNINNRTCSIELVSVESWSYNNSLIWLGKDSYDMLSSLG